jgi:hypothetical protein
MESLRRRFGLRSLSHAAHIGSFTLRLPDATLVADPSREPGHWPASRKLAHSGRQLLRREENRRENPCHSPPVLKLR